MTWTDRAIGWGIVVLMLLVLGFSAGWAWAVIVGVFIKVGIYAVSAMGLNLHFGYTGLLNFGHVGFMLVGAYTAVLLLPHSLGRTATEGGSWPLWAAIIAALSASAVLGLLMGIPTLRLRGDFLAITTIAIAEILRLLALGVDFTGTSFGVIQYDDALQDLRPGFVDSIADAIDAPATRMWLMVVAWLCVLLVFVVMQAMVRSPWGRVLRSIREDEDAARALGKNAFWFKLQSLMIGGAIGGLAGVLLAFDLTAISPATFPATVTFFVWTIMILGGAGTLGGPIAGSLVFWVLITQTDTFAEALFSDFSLLTVAQFRFILLGALLIGLIVFRPQGLFGNKEELSLEIQ